MSVDVALVVVLVLVHPFAMRADIAVAHVPENHRMYTSVADGTESNNLYFATEEKTLT